MMQSLDQFGRRFLIFGLVTSIVFTAGSALMLAFPFPGNATDPITMIACIAIFAPMTAVYAVALRRRGHSAPTTT
jgi:hypothetical protein